MAVAALRQADMDVPERLRETVAAVGRRGYALSPRRLGELCVGGPLTEGQVLAALDPAGLRQVEGVVCTAALVPEASRTSRRQAGHRRQSEPYLREAVTFGSRLAELFPFVIAVSVAGSLASGGFAETDDVDLNLVVEDGYRHLAYFCLNACGVLHALRHRGKPVDALSRRPISPRVMTANLILERSQCFPLARTDVDMAYELLSSVPIVGAAFLRGVVVANAELRRHFPQLARPLTDLAAAPTRRAPRWLFPRRLDGPARVAGRAAWRYLQWTRRGSPEALARVAFVRRTMRPYALFE